MGRGAPVKRCEICGWLRSECLHYNHDEQDRKLLADIARLGHDGKIVILADGYVGCVPREHETRT